MQLSKAISALACTIPWVASGAYMVLQKSQNPMPQIVQLIEELKGKIEADGKEEQASYDKYACYCEDTLGAKAADISAGKENIEALQTSIVKLKSQIATDGANIKNLDKNIAGNVASQKEATEMRSKESAEYRDEKVESEQCIGALEAAVGVLAGAGASKGTHLLATMQEAQLLSAAAGIRGILTKSALTRAMSDDDLSVVRQFVEKPEDFVVAKASGAFLSAAQITNNPFGDYAPASTQIQGILKGMYDTFAGDLERSNAEESNKQKAFEALMATKKAELTTLQATLEQTTLNEATATKQLAVDKTAVDDAQTQLAADEAFFAATKSTCTAKSSEWNTRARLRTEELAGMAKAIEILQGGAETFVNATSTFLQVASVQRHNQAADKAYDRLRSLATQYKNLNLARLAASLKTGGHFDKVIASIDTMIKTLRTEEAEDIAHRDRCQGSVGRNANSMEDLGYNTEKANKEIARHADETTQLKEKLKATEGDINATKTDMAELLQMRNKENADFLQALKTDKEAVELLGKAIASLTAFYENNNIPLNFAQKEEPQYSAAPPETSWNAEYGDRNQESGGVIAILGMIKEDLVKEQKVAAEDDASAQKAYESDVKSMRSMLSAQESSKTVTESELADLMQKVVDLEAYIAAQSGDLKAAEEMAAALSTDCSWVDSHFQTRFDKRKTELDGLVEAKNYLAGVEDGTAIP